MVRISYIERLKPMPERVLIAGAGINGEVWWRGAHLEPGMMTDAEVRLPREVVLNDLMEWRSDNAPPPRRGSALLHGTLLDVDEHHVITLEATGGGIVLMDGSEAIDNLRRGTTVCIESSEFEIFPTGI